MNSVTGRIQNQAASIRSRHLLLVFVVLGSLVLTLLQQPFGQDLRYHLFGDVRSLAGIPNLLNVVSNLPFALVGIAGLRFVLGNLRDASRSAWLTFFAGVALVSVGSAYYHWAPDNATLVWDRLPMTIGFMGLFVALLCEYVDARLGKLLLVPALLVGFASVLYWHAVDDLRLYAWVQLVPVLTIPLVVVLYRGRKDDRWPLFAALTCYVLAKFAEAYDQEVFTVTYGLLSGHSLKHLLAALGAFAVLWMLKKRRALEELPDSPAG